MFGNALCVRVLMTVTRGRGGKHVKVLWLLLKSRLGRKHFLAVNHSLILHSLKHFIQMTLTVLGVMPGVKRLPGIHFGDEKTILY